MAEKKEALTKREANKIDVHRRILKASRRLFASNGYDETMMRDIAKRADVSKATVYNYFPNKESLLIGTLDGVIDEAVKAAASKKDLPASERLCTAFETFLLGGMKYPDLSRRITYLNSTEGSALYGSTGKIYHFFGELIKEAKENGEFDPDASDYMIIDMIFGIFLIAQYQWMDIDRLSSVELLERARAYYDRFVVQQFSAK